MTGSPLDPRVHEFLRRSNLEEQAALRAFYADRPHLDTGAAEEGRDDFTPDDRAAFNALMAQLDRQHTREGEELDAILKAEAAASTRQVG